MTVSRPHAPPRSRPPSGPTSWRPSPPRPADRDRPALASRRIARLLIAPLLVAALSATGCAWLDERVRLAAFRPSSDVPAAFTGLLPGDERFRVPAGNPHPDEQWVEMWWMPAAEPGAPTLLYLHGTFRNLHHNYPKMRAIRDAGFAVLGVEYRGWGASSPLVPSEASIHADAARGWRELARRQPVPGLRVIYGHSMGAAAAVELAARRSEAANGPDSAGAADFGGLILESAFNRATDVATAATVLATPLDWFGGVGFESQRRIGAVRAPILMLHGTADRTVPIVLGRRLHEAAPEPRTFVAFEGGSHSRLHTDAPDRYRAVFAAFATRMRDAALAPRGTTPDADKRYDDANAGAARDRQHLTPPQETLPCPPSSSSPTMASVVKSPSSPACR